MTTLARKHETFVREYLVDLNGTQAAIRAGYSAKTAAVSASKMLIIPKIRDSINKAMKDREKRTEVSQDFVIQTIKDVIDDAGQKVQDDGGKLIMNNHAAVLKGAELLGRHLKLFVDKVEVSTGDGLSALIQEARSRVKK